MAVAAELQAVRPGGREWLAVADRSVFAPDQDGVERSDEAPAGPPEDAPAFAAAIAVEQTAHRPDSFPGVAPCHGDEGVGLLAAAVPPGLAGARLERATLVEVAAPGALAAWARAVRKEPGRASEVHWEP